MQMIAIYKKKEKRIMINDQSKNEKKVKLFNLLNSFRGHLASIVFPAFTGIHPAALQASCQFTKVKKVLLV